MYVYTEKNIILFFTADDKSLELSKNDIQLRVLRKTTRVNKFSPFGFRSKYIFIPNQLKLANNHFIYEFQKGIEVHVPTDIGILHHYRGGCEEVEFDIKNNYAKFVDLSVDCRNQPTTFDRRMHRYKTALLENVKRVLLKTSLKYK